MTAVNSGAKTMALQDDALRLAELDRQVVQTLIEANTEKLSHVLSAYLKLRVGLKRQMLDESVISVEDATACEVLHKIASSDGLQSDKFVKRLKQLKGYDALATGEFDDADIEELGSKLFYSWYSHHEYVRALDELRPMILRCDTSESVERLVERVRRCYAFEQYDATFGLCRTLLEASIRDICVRRGLFPELSNNAILYEKCNWRQLRDRVSSGRLNEKLKDLYGRLCEVLHARKAVVSKDAREVFLETLLVIEKLYESQ